MGGPCLVTPAGHSMGPRTPGAHSMRPRARSRPLPPRLGGTAPRVSSSAIAARGLLGLHCELCLTASHGPASGRTSVGWTHTSGCTLHGTAHHRQLCQQSPLELCSVPPVQLLMTAERRTLAPGRPVCLSAWGPVPTQLGPYLLLTFGLTPCR